MFCLDKKKSWPLTVFKILSLFPFRFHGRDYMTHTVSSIIIHLFVSLNSFFFLIIKWLTWTCHCVKLYFRIRQIGWVNVKAGKWLYRVLMSFRDRLKILQGECKAIMNVYMTGKIAFGSYFRFMFVMGIG